MLMVLFQWNREWNNR